jgi:hypothetical protein
MTTRILEYYEIYELARNEKFVATVQAVALKRCMYFKLLHEATVLAGNFATLTSQQKKEYLFSRKALEGGAIQNNTGFARNYALKLLYDAVGINMEDAGSAAWNPQEVTNELVDSAILSDGHATFAEVWELWVNQETESDQYFTEYPAFGAKVKNALLKAATAAVGEGTGTYPQAAVDKRHSFGVSVINSPDSYATTLKYAVASNPAIHEFSTESDIEFTVNSMFNDFAAVTAANLA